MMPRPPQSKHASSLPLFASLLDRSRAASSFCPVKRPAIHIDIPFVVANVRDYVKEIASNEKLKDLTENA